MDAPPTVFITKELIKRFMPKYKRHDDLVLIQECVWEDFKRNLPLKVVRFDSNPYCVEEDELASLVCQIVQKPQCRRLAIDKGVKNDQFRSPNIELILGENGIVTHNENHLTYKFDITKCMFSFGNIKEKMRMAELNCQKELVVDLFAGIGYFTLPLLVHAKAKHLYACEWNPDAVAALKDNLKINKVPLERYTIIEGDSRTNRPVGVAQRVILGILPSSADSMLSALECVDRKTGAVLHCHELVESFVVSPISNSFSPGNGHNGTPPNDNAQNNSSNSSSPSQIEKISMSAVCEINDKISEKGNNSPVFLEKPSTSSAESGELLPKLNDTISTCSSDHTFEESILELTDNDNSLYQSKAQSLIARIHDDLESYRMTARLIQYVIVKSYAPHVNHVVFDIEIRPTKSE